jgi:D-xylose transport system permease protein
MPTASDPESAQPSAEPRIAVSSIGLQRQLGDLQRKLKGGELGSIPVVVGLIVIAAVFQTANGQFLSAQNLSNLAMQVASTGVMAIGLVLVLLLGEIDLSVGSVSGLTAAAMVILNVQHGWPTGISIAAAVAFGAAIGLVHGLIFAKAGVPAFVLTLAGLIGWQGLQLFILGSHGTINVPYNGGIASLANTFYPPAVGYALGAVIVAVYLLSAIKQRRRRRKAGLRTQPLLHLLVRAALLLVLLVAVTAVLGKWRGVPLPLLIFGGLVVITDLVLRRTRFGRRIFAVGGNIEAARRAGINIAQVRISVFVLCSAFAAVGGVLAASRLFAVNQQSGSGDVLLNAIAAAVIGGTSLFGGRGSTYSALLGILVIGAVSNGMDLLNQASSVKFMITGAVLLAAVVIDSLSRRTRNASGRA